MNPLTLVKRIQKLNTREAELGISEDASWHAKYKDSAYVYVGGIPFDLTEGDLLAIFAQYGELVDVNLVRDKATGKSRGYAFIAYEDQRSTNLAVDNLNAAQILGRTIRVDHVTKYKKKEEEDEEEELKKREERGVCRAFQKGECTRGAGCKFSHNEQRAANTGWGDEEDRRARSGHDKFVNENQKNEKVGVCRSFQRGECTYGDRCKFSHDEQRAGHDKFVNENQKNEKVGVCRSFQRGECTYGDRCKFSHEEQRAANTGWGNEENRRSRLGREPERRPAGIPSVRDRESGASARHKENEIDAGRSRRREGENYTKPSEIDYKDRDGRDRSRKSEMQEKIIRKEDRDTRGADRSSLRGGGEKRSRHDDIEEYHPRENRDEKRSRRPGMEEYNPRENRNDREKDREIQRESEEGKERRSSHARDSSSLRSRDRDDGDDHYRSRR